MRYCRIISKMKPRSVNSHALRIVQANELTKNSNKLKFGIQVGMTIVHDILRVPKNCVLVLYPAGGK